MHSTADWANASTTTMKRANAAVTHAHAQCDQSAKAQNISTTENFNMYDTVQYAMGHKVKTSNRLIRKLQLRADSIEQSMFETRKMEASLQKAIQAQEAPLKLCLWRLEQREKRPHREQVQDAVETALEQEKSTLVEAQRKLTTAMNQTRNLHTDLEVALSKVRSDIGHKMQALGVDEMCLHSTHRSRLSVLDRTAPPAPVRKLGLGSTGTIGTAGQSGGFLSKTKVPETARQLGVRNEVTRFQDAERLNKELAAKEEGARLFREDQAKLIQRCSAVTSDANNKTRSRFQERINELTSVRRRLERDMVETQLKIDHVKGVMSDTKYQIKVLEEPADLAATCCGWRQQRMHKELIHDLVSTSLKQQRHTVYNHQKDLVAHHSSEKNHLKELLEHLSMLRSDLRDKCVALEIDTICLQASAPMPLSTMSAISAKFSQTATTAAPSSIISLAPLGSSTVSGVSCTTRKAATDIGLLPRMALSAR